MSPQTCHLMDVERTRSFHLCSESKEASLTSSVDLTAKIRPHGKMNNRKYSARVDGVCLGPAPPPTGQCVCILNSGTLGQDRGLVSFVLNFPESEAALLGEKEHEARAPDKLEVKNTERQRPSWVEGVLWCEIPEEYRMKKRKQFRSEI